MRTGRILMVIGVFLMFAGAVSALEFTMDIYVHSGDEDTVSQIGVLDSASNDFDMYDWPSMGFPPALTLQFEHPGAIYGPLVRDIRSSADSVQLWDGSIVNATDTIITLTWTPPDIADSAELLIWAHSYADTDTVWDDMLTMDSMTIPNGYKIAIKYRYLGTTDTTLVDTIPPEIVGYSIADGETLSDPMTPFVATVVDTQSGVNPHSLVFTINGLDLSFMVTDSAVGDTTIFTYTPMIPYAPVDTVVFGVSDQAGNSVEDTIIFYYTIPDTGDTGSTSDSLFVVTCMVMLTDISTSLSGSIVEIMDLGVMETTDVSGRCVFDSIPAGVHEFKAAREGYFPVDTFVSVDSNITVMFMLTPYDSGAFIVSGTVLLEGVSGDLSGSIVTAMGLDSVPIYDTTDATGYYELELPMFGTYMIVAEHDSFYPDTVFGFFYDDTTVNFELRRGAGITEHKNSFAETEIYLTDEDFLMSKGFERVELFDFTGRLITEFRLDEQKSNKISLNGLPNGVYLIRASRKDYSVVKRIIIVR